MHHTTIEVVHERLTTARRDARPRPRKLPTEARTRIGARGLGQALAEQLATWRAWLSGARRPGRTGCGEC